MFGTLLSTVVAAIVNVLLGRFFPSHPKVTPEAIATAQQARGDILQSQKDARHEADTLRTAVRADLDSKPVGDPSGVYRADANERD